jgi:hypothetical protein
MYQATTAGERRVREFQVPIKRENLPTAYEPDGGPDTVGVEEVDGANLVIIAEHTP